MRGNFLMFSMSRSVKVPSGPVSLREVWMEAGIVAQECCGHLHVEHLGRGVGTGGSGGAGVSGGGGGVGAGATPVPPETAPVMLRGPLLSWKNQQTFAAKEKYAQPGYLPEAHCVQQSPALVPGVWPSPWPSPW